MRLRLPRRISQRDLQAFLTARYAPTTRRPFGAVVTRNAIVRPTHDGVTVIGQPTSLIVILIALCTLGMLWLLPRYRRAEREIVDLFVRELDAYE